MSSVTIASEDFRNVVLRGRNVASFKFALAKSVLELTEAGKTSASLEELAVPFSRELCEHIREVATQATSAGSRFLDACRHFNAGTINHEELVETTALLGFNNVIDAFHVVGDGYVEAVFPRRASAVPARHPLHRRTTRPGRRARHQIAFGS